QGHALLLQAETRRGSTLGKLGCLEEARQVLEEVLALAPAISGDSAILWSAVTALCLTCMSLGTYDQALRRAVYALQLAERLGNPTSELLARSNHGWSAYLLGDWRQARTALEQAVAMAQQRVVSWATPYPLLNLGVLCLSEGQPHVALSYVEQGTALAEQNNDLQLMQWLPRKRGE